MNSKVFVKRIHTMESSQYSEAAREVFIQAYLESGYQFEQAVPIKVHFGEKGNETYVKPFHYQGIVQALKELGVKPLYIETNVLYRGSRTTRDSHMAVALAHGFDDLPIEIADGERGEAYIEVPIHKHYFDVCKIGAGFEKY